MEQATESNKRLNRYELFLNKRCVYFNKHSYNYLDLRQFEIAKFIIRELSEIQLTTQEILVKNVRTKFNELVLDIAKKFEWKTSIILESKYRWIVSKNPLYKLRGGNPYIRKNLTEDACVFVLNELKNIFLYKKRVHSQENRWYYKIKLTSDGQKLAEILSGESNTNTKEENMEDNQ